MKWIMTKNEDMLLNLAHVQAFLLQLSDGWIITAIYKDGEQYLIDRFESKGQAKSRFFILARLLNGARPSRKGDSK